MPRDQPPFRLYSWRKVGSRRVSEGHGRHQDGAAGSRTPAGPAQRWHGRRLGRRKIVSRFPSEGQVKKRLTEVAPSQQPLGRTGVKSALNTKNLVKPRIPLHLDNEN